MKIKLLFIALIAILLSAGSVDAQHRGHGRGYGHGYGVRHGYHGPRHAYYGPRHRYYRGGRRVYVAAPVYRRSYGYHRGYRRGYYGHHRGYRRGYAPRARVSVRIGH